MASSSSHVAQVQYDVFISFRGSDTRHGFLSHLTKELCRKQIDVYVDDRLERGDEISSALLRAIEGSKISLVIFSEDYASSKWCLEELVKIIECKAVNQQIVIPVFYNIDPTNVRHQKGTFEDAFAQHEQRYNMDKLQSYRSILHEAANLSGYHYSSNSEDESKLIEKIAKDVRKKLDDLCPIDEPKGLVGIEEKFAFFEQFLKIESKEVRVIGIWGMGGIGKTTLADFACHKFSSQFESNCFLENVREESKKNGLSYLRKKLVLELLEEENLHIHDITRAKLQHLETRLHSKKVLLVLDDMDDREQLECLVRERDCWGPGSRVIITSRDKHVLNDERVDTIHEVQELNFQDSLKLFSLNAFNLSLPTMKYEELSKQVVGYAKGIPLALKVLGSYLHTRDMKTWESVIGKLKKHPNVQIQNVLKVSYDGLDYTEKEIFLDIAFFFKGQKKDDVIRILDACNFYAESGIATLVDKALITISNDNEIQMHDLLQEMGEQIVREESTRDPRRRSRLRDVEEVLDVLKNNKGTDAAEGITLDCNEISKDIHLSPDIFYKMSNLRILKITSLWGWKYLNLPSGLKSFPNELRYLHWDGYPLQSLPLVSCAEKLVELCIRYSHVQKLWDGVKDLVNLKKIDFSESKQLMELPDFSKACNLEVVNLYKCESLCSVHPSILSCHTLVSLNLFGCKELRSLQSEIHFESLKDLEVRGCYNLKEFSLSSQKVQYLDLSETEIEMLHSSFGHFKVLDEVKLNGSTLKSLPIKELCMLTSLSGLSIYNYNQVISKRELCILFEALPNLEKLNLNGCMKLFEIPNNISALSRLECLFLNRSGIETLPASIKLLSKLGEVHLTDCWWLRSLPELPQSITCLDFSGSTSLVTLPATIKHLSKLKKVCLKYCRRLESLPELPPSITTLDVIGCTSLERVHNLPLSHIKHDERPDYLFFSFLGCMKMDEQSLCNVMEFSHILMMEVPHITDDGNAEAQVCYPGSEIPKWLKYKATGKSSITLELAPSSQPLLGFVFCCVLPQLPFTSTKSAVIECDIDGKSEFEGFRIRNEGPCVNLTDLNTDHVFLWYCDLFEHYEITTWELEFQFFLNPKHMFDQDKLIKACGVCPIYASDNGIEGNETDDQLLSTLTMKLKESCTIELPPLGLELQPRFQTKIVILSSRLNHSYLKSHFVLRL